MSYSVIRTQKAEDQLRDILFYRAEITGSPQAALDLLDRFEKGIMQLSEYPNSGAPPRYPALRARGFRVLIIEKFLVFYKSDPRQETVTVYAVVDGRRDYRNLI